MIKRVKRRKQRTRGCGTTASDLMWIGGEQNTRYDHLSFTTVFEGWVKKQGNSNKAWKDRYCVLCPPGCLFYFRKKEDVEIFKSFKILEAKRKKNRIGHQMLAKPAIKANFVLGSCPVVGLDFQSNVKDPPELRKVGEHYGEAHVFTVNVRAKGFQRRFYFAVADDEDLQSWMKAIDDIADYDDHLKAKRKENIQKMDGHRRSILKAYEKQRANTKIDRYKELFQTCRHPFTLGTVHINGEVWEYTNGGQEPVIEVKDSDDVRDINADAIVCKRGKYAGVALIWGGCSQNGKVLITTEDPEIGHCSWDGHLLQWHSPYGVHRGTGRWKVWVYSCSPSDKPLEVITFKANFFTLQQGFPESYRITSKVESGVVTSSKIEDAFEGFDAEVHGSVPPHIIVVCTHYSAMREHIAEQQQMFAEMYPDREADIDMYGSVDSYRLGLKEEEEHIEAEQVFSDSEYESDYASDLSPRASRPSDYNPRTSSADGRRTSAY